ncbi:hypothetical protein THAOC_04492, partial [Thalassiosira oceanica]
MLPLTIGRSERSPGAATTADVITIPTSPPARHAPPIAFATWALSPVEPPSHGRRVRVARRRQRSPQSAPAACQSAIDRRGPPSLARGPGYAGNRSCRLRARVLHTQDDCAADLAARFQSLLMLGGPSIGPRLRCCLLLAPAARWLPPCGKDRSDGLDRNAADLTFVRHPFVRRAADGTPPPATSPTAT